MYLHTGISDVMESPLNASYGSEGAYQSCLVMNYLARKSSLWLCLGNSTYFFNDIIFGDQDN